MNILIISPHPDDDILGCGGSIINHRKNGDTVSILYVTSGESGDAKIPKIELAATRENEAALGAKAMEVSNTIFLRQPDGAVISNPVLLKEMTEIIRQEHPDCIYIPNKNDGHADHKATYEVSMEAIYRAGAQAFQEYTGEPWAVSTVLAYEVWTPLLTVSYVEDITDGMDQKIAALQCHTSQLANVAYDEAIKGLNRYRGALTGKGKFCECFEVIKLTSFYR